MFSKKTSKWILIIFIFLIAITLIRLCWLGFLSTLNYTEQPVAAQGILDLREWEFSNHQTLRLDGEWEFFPSTFLSARADAGQEELFQENKIFLQVPGYWGEHFPKEIGGNTFHYGTYRLRILVHPDVEQTFALRMNELRNAATIYLNGQRVGGNGEPATEFGQHQARTIPYTVSLTPEQGQLDLVIHASSHLSTGGVIKPIRFGTLEAIQLRTNLSISLQLLLSIVILIHGLHALILYLLGSRSKELVYFALLMFCAIFSVLTADDKLLFAWLKTDYFWSTKIGLLAYISTLTFIPSLFHHLLPNYLNKKFLYLFNILCSTYALSVLLVPIQFYLPFLKILGLQMLVSVLISVYILWKAMKDREDIIFLLLACLFIGVNVVWTIAFSNLNIEFIHYPFDLMFAIFAFAAFWFRRFFRATSAASMLAEKLQLEDKRKDEFLVNTSHELRNPLHGIINITQSILEDKMYPLHSEHKQRLDLLIRVSKRLSLLLDDLIDVTRLKEKTISLDKKKVRLPPIFVGVGDLIRLMLDGKPIQLHLKIEEDFPAVFGDENRIIQILFNLAHNAVKYTNEGSITIQAKLHKQMAHIEVEDTGIGIEKEMIDRILQPYEQAHVNAIDERGGLGLGLNICHQLIQLHGGTLSIQSTLGKGSVFTFSLPIYHPSEAGETEAEATILLSQAIQEVTELTATTQDILPTYGELLAYPQEMTYADTRKPSILVVDDDSINLTVLRHILEPEAYEITTVTNAELALATLDNERYDLVISDVMMPTISGYELTRLIRERYSLSELPVLLLTARVRPEDIEAGFQVGANDYVKKPVDAAELRARVHVLTRLKLSVEEHLRMEGAWLQSQIQPHFIYNTLNSIAALGVMDLPKMQDLLEEFSNYLRLSFDFKNAEPLVPLEHELALVRSYLAILKERFGERLQVEWELDTHLNFALPPLSIQPLVENAVVHGILQRGKGGNICIRINKHPEHVEIAITDDGKGISKEKLASLLKQTNPSSERVGIGLRNIDRRLKQLYGQGLRIESLPEKGTTVSFSIPKN